MRIDTIFTLKLLARLSFVLTYTYCDEYDVTAPARDEYVGHSAGKLTNAYRDLSDE